jgi:hypothetical protein
LGWLATPRYQLPPGTAMNKLIHLCTGLHYLFGLNAAIAQTPQTDTIPLLGEWRYTSMHQINKNPYSIFVLKLYKTSAHQINGSYCFITEEGRRIECDPEGTSNLNRTVSPDGLYATVNFFSFLGAKNGISDISLHNGKLRWKVTKNPDGDFFTAHSMPPCSRIPGHQKIDW